MGCSSSRPVDDDAAGEGSVRDAERPLAITPRSKPAPPTPLPDASLPTGEMQQRVVGMVAEIRKTVPRTSSRGDEHSAASDERDQPEPQSSSAPALETLTKDAAPKVDAALREILETERAYCIALRTLVDRYMRPLQPLLGDDVPVIFGKCEIILGVNEALLQQLQGALATTSDACLLESVAAVARAFLTIVPFLRSYAIYCSGYFAALERLTKLTADQGGTLATTIRRLEAEVAEDGGAAGAAGGFADLRLAACLIKPVQRLCRYPLLLEGLLAALKKATGQCGRHPAIELLLQANDKVRGMADNVNKMVRDAESRVKMLEVHERLRGACASLITPSRRFVLEAEVAVSRPKTSRGGGAGARAGEACARGTPKEHKLLLFSDLLLLARPERRDKNCLQLGMQFRVEELVLEWAVEGAAEESLQRSSALPRRSSTVPAAARDDSSPTVEGPSAFWLRAAEGSVHVGCGSAAAARQLYDSLVEAKGALVLLQSSPAFETRRTQMADAAPEEASFDSSSGFQPVSSWRGAGKKSKRQSAQKPAVGLSWPTSTLARTFSGLKTQRGRRRDSESVGSTRRASEAAADDADTDCAASEASEASLSFPHSPERLGSLERKQSAHASSESLTLVASHADALLGVQQMRQTNSGRSLGPD